MIMVSAQVRWLEVALMGCLPIWCPAIHDRLTACYTHEKWNQPSSREASKAVATIVLHAIEWRMSDALR
jgi:hypothetical protein